MKVSDQTMEKVLSSLVVNRQKRRGIQGMTAPELTRYLAEVYRKGFEDGASAVEDAARQQQEEETQVEWEDVLNMISQVKGVGPKLTAAIDKKLREVY